MLYRTYKAPTYKEAVVNAKMDLGSDVYIIGRKDIKEGGFLGLFRKQFTEITVAKNEDISKVLAEKIKKRTDAEKKPVDTQPSESGVKPPNTPMNSGTELPSISGEIKAVNIISELGKIKKQLDQIMQDQGGEENPALTRLVHLLRENDFSDDYIAGIRNALEKELTLKDINTPGVFSERVTNYILNTFDVSGPIEAGTSKPGIVVLVGPTGVGKTTTIAKLAASFGVLQKKKIELITIDFYRIAAIEQLGKYAELMQIPFVPVNTREEFKNAVKNSTAELIFVDTVGRSQRNNLGLAELRNILDGVKSNMDVHLVLSATTKYRDAIDIVTRFNQLLYEKVIITKLDETNSLGSLLSALQGKKISYLTTGQSVPDDIEVAEKKRLLDMIVLDGLDRVHACEVDQDTAPPGRNSVFT